MFDIGFAELIIIFTVGLFVIGPERLPSTVRTIALWIGRIRRSISEMRQDIEQQIGADDIRRELHNEQVLRNLERLKDTHADLEDKITQWSQGKSAPSPAESADDATTQNTSPEEPQSNSDVSATEDTDESSGDKSKKTDGQSSGQPNP